MENKIKQIQKELEKVMMVVKQQDKVIESLREGNEMQLDFNNKIFSIVKEIENNESRWSIKEYEGLEVSRIL